MTESTNSESAASVVAPLRTPLPCATSAFLTSAITLASVTPLSAIAASISVLTAAMNLGSLVNGFSAVGWMTMRRDETNVLAPVLPVLDIST